MSRQSELVKQAQDIGSGFIDIDGAGRVTKAGQPSFFATLSGQQSDIADGTNVRIAFDTVTQVGSGFNTSTHEFVCPVTGVYLFCFNGYAYYTRQAEIALFKNGVKTIRSVGPVVSADANPNGASGSGIIKCNAGDILYCEMYGDTGGQNWNIYHHEGTTTFSGYLLG